MMMIKRSCYAFGTILLLTIFLAQPASAVRLWGTAEDLWGNKIDLSALTEGVVLIHPLSTSH